MPKVKRAGTVAARALDAAGAARDRERGKVTSIRKALEAPQGLVALEVASVDAAARTARLRLGDTEVGAELDRALDAAVVETALTRGERLIAQREGARYVVLGALRTARTPGLEEGDEYVIRARRVHIEAEHEFGARSGSASFVLRAYGYVETLAQDITTRASSVHKVIGRMLRLN